LTTNLVGEVIVISDDSDTSAKDQSHARALDPGGDAKSELEEHKIKEDEIEDEDDNKDEEGEGGVGEEDPSQISTHSPRETGMSSLTFANRGSTAMIVRGSSITKKTIATTYQSSHKSQASSSISMNGLDVLFGEF
jgi:hypothetical protein